MSIFLIRDSSEELWEALGGALDGIQEACRRHPWFQSLKIFGENWISIHSNKGGYTHHARWQPVGI